MTSIIISAIFCTQSLTETLGSEIPALNARSPSKSRKGRLQLTRMDFPRSIEPSRKELECYIYEYYKRLKSGTLKVRISDSAYQCPFCHRDYSFWELLDHTAIVTTNSPVWDVRGKAKHMALESYAKKYCEPKPASSNRDQLFAYPWKGIVANITTQVVDGRRVGESGTSLREKFSALGFSPKKVHPLWSYKGHSGFAIVEFDNDWEGFRNAVMFEKSFEVKHRGKNDYFSRRQRGNDLYCWVAREDDYNVKGLIGDYLRKHGDLKSVSGKEAEDQTRVQSLVHNLAQTLKNKHMQLKEMENIYDATSKSLNQVMMENDETARHYNEELQRLQQIAIDNFRYFFESHEKFRRKLTAKKLELDREEKHLYERHTQNKAKRKKIEHEKLMNERAIVEQKKAEESVVRLAEQQKILKEKLHQEIIGLEKKLDAKQALELEIERMKGKLQVKRHLGEEVEALQADLKKKEEEYEALEALNQTLIIKERNTNDELQYARKELISGMKELSGRSSSIGVKRMGELDEKPFIKAAKVTYLDQTGEKALELCSLWEDHLRDPNWHPFKIQEKDGKAKEVIDEEDEKLKGLKEELGDEVFNAVVRALMEMNEYNPSGRYVVSELWNLKEQRQATLSEASCYIVRYFKYLKAQRKKQRTRDPLG